MGGVFATIYAVILEFAWDNLGHFWGHFCGHYGHVWGPFWCRFAVILGTFGGLFGLVRGFQSVTIPQQDVGVAITRGGIGEMGGEMGLDFCEHLVSICRSKGVAHMSTCSRTSFGFASRVHERTFRAAVSAALARLHWPLALQSALASNDR